MKAKNLKQAKEFTLDKFKTASDSFYWYSIQLEHPHFRDGDSEEKLQRWADYYDSKARALRDLLFDVMGYDLHELMMIQFDIKQTNYEVLANMYKSRKMREEATA